MSYANLYAIFFGIFVIWFRFSSVCSLVLDYFAGDAFVADDIDHIDAGRKGTHTEMGVGHHIGIFDDRLTALTQNSHDLIVDTVTFDATASVVE